MTASRTIKNAFMAVGVAAAAFTALAADAPSVRAEDVTLTMAVPDWPPTRIMKRFFDEQYKPKSGNNVNAWRR